MNRIVLATSNPGKIDEMRALLSPLGIEVVSPAEMGVELTIEETGTTFAENARIKAEAYALALSMKAVADDSGLVVDALDGRPGIQSARFGGPELDDAGRVELLLRSLCGVAEAQRSARFIAAIAFADPDRPTVVFEGAVEGSIAQQPRGNAGFGYDPVFIYGPFGKTFAEAGVKAKSSVSHRGRALQKLVDYLSLRPGDDILSKRSGAQGDR
jgi:XTP/dITP diphosphohydrolase